MLVIAYWLHLKMLAVSVFDGVFQVIWPLFFATTAFLVYRKADDPAVMVYAGLGSSVMGIWSVVATSCSTSGWATTISPTG